MALEYNIYEWRERKKKEMLCVTQYKLGIYNMCFVRLTEFFTIWHFSFSILTVKCTLPWQTNQKCKIQKSVLTMYYQHNDAII